MDKKTIFTICFAVFTIILFFILHKKGTTKPNTTCSCSPSCPNGICPGGQSCQNGICQGLTCQCSSSCPMGTCPQGAFCQNGSCQAQPPPSSCACSSSCPSGTCPAGQTCQNGSCQDIPPSSCTCSSSCPSGTCPTGQTCQNGSCQCNTGMYGKNCDVRVGTLQYLQPAGSYVSGGYLNYDTTAPINGNVNFESTSNTKWFFKEDGTGSLRNFDWMANPSYPAIGINPSNWYGGRSDDTSFNSTCLAVGDETSCMKTTDLYTTTGKIPDSDGNWKVNSFNSSQCNGGICYPTLIGSIQDNSIVTAWAGPRWPSGNNDYEYDWVPGSKITWVDLPLSEAEKQRAMQL